jgi:HEAT repeat protein
VPALLAGLARPSPGIEFQMAVGKALKAIGPSAVPPLRAALRAGQARTRFYAARALSKLGPAAAPAVPALIDVLEHDRDYGVRGSAAAALGAIGPPAHKAMPALRRAAGNPNTPFSGDPERDELRVAAQMALRQLRDGGPY